MLKVWQHVPSPTRETVAGKSVVTEQLTRRPWLLKVYTSEVPSTKMLHASSIYLISVIKIFAVRYNCDSEWTQFFIIITLWILDVTNTKRKAFSKNWHSILNRYFIIFSGYGQIKLWINNYLNQSSILWRDIASLNWITSTFWCYSLFHW